MILSYLDRDDNGPRICKIRLNHIGKNYPCLEDSYHGIKSPRNTSYYSYSTSKTESTAEFYLDRLVNWGKFISVLNKTRTKTSIRYAKDNDREKRESKKGRRRYIYI